MSSLDEMRTYVQIIESNGIGAAASVLGVAKSVVSRRLALLEQRLGSKLIERTTRSFAPTDLGTEYYQRVSRILHDIDELDTFSKHSAESLNGSLRISLPSIFGRYFLAPRILAFLDAYPNIKLQCDFTDRIVNLIEEQYDAAVRISKLPDSSLIVRHLTDTRHVLCASPDYLNSHPAIYNLNDLKQHRLLAFGSANRIHKRLYDPDGSTHVLQGPSAVNSNDGEFLRQATLAGKGIFLAPNFLVSDALESGRLHRVLEDLSGPLIPINIVYSERQLMTQRLRVFIDFLMHACSANYE